MSMFGGVGHFIGQVFASGGGATGGGGPSVPPGGFPGIFPGGGVSNSGWAGLNELQNRQPCTPLDAKNGKCVMGPPAGLSGAKRPGWR
jgi:hypothetical protein